MGAITKPKPVLLLIAASSRYDEALAWGLERAQEQFGKAALVSPAFDFTETDYYLEEMGPDLKKQFWAFQQTIDPSELAAVKRATNDLEVRYIEQSDHSEPRPLNLDPGYLTLAKLILASTKDHAHRIYLQQGIYAELTLQYRKKAWQALPWTYPDYQREDFQAFFSECRQQLR
ncbi:DUF4416 family protein [Adhaeretor mobilis]|uniref:GTP-binding protein n=1 Tax=Adhaeretor mobilis TaxID=1930276 RepID=A0A517N249_9BACT|nr:DUF4416 family protein [Adhaeretor mobilis]QDT01203.1 hypothetical protein HG15A2_45450 [Adhaeretor mobilis]